MENKESICSCNKCKMMCHVSPCFPTPDDTIKLIEAGFEDQLIRSTYIDLRTFNAYDIIAPTSTKHNFTRADGETFHLNRCSFLNENNLCSLHDKGLKPTEGKLANCSNNEDHAVQLRIDICNTWKDNEQADKLFKFFE